MSSESFLWSLPKSILKFIINKLTFYQCYALGSCNRLFYSLTLDSEDFWKQRCKTDFGDDDVIMIGDDFKANYKCLILQLRTYTIFTDEPDNLYDRIQAHFTQFDFSQFAQIINIVVKCQLYTGIEKKIYDLIVRTVNMPADNTNDAYLSMRKSFLSSLTLIKFIWNSYGAYRKELFNHNFLFQCVDHECLEVIDKVICRKRSVEVAMGLLILSRVIQREKMGYQIPDTIMNKGFELIECEIKNPGNFIRLNGTKALASQIYSYKIDPAELISRDRLDMLVNKLLNRVVRMDEVLAKDIYQELLIKCCNHLSTLTWILSLPIPNFIFDLNVISIFGIKFRPNTRHMEFKTIIDDYIKRHPGCITEQNYDKLVNIQVEKEGGGKVEAESVQND